MSAEVHALSGSYALDAVEPTERTSFEAHAGACPACRIEVLTLRETAAHLTSLVAVTPPPELRRKMP